jgi:hypothetical protein
VITIAAYWRFKYFASQTIRQTIYIPSTHTPHWARIAGSLAPTTQLVVRKIRVDVASISGTKEDPSITGAGVAQILTASTELEANEDNEDKDDDEDDAEESVATDGKIH